jgi:hypothetical protein
MTASRPSDLCEALTIANAVRSSSLKTARTQADGGAGISGLMP